MQPNLPKMFAVKSRPNFGTAATIQQRAQTRSWMTKGFEEPRVTAINRGSSGRPPRRWTGKEPSPASKLSMPTQVTVAHDPAKTTIRWQVRSAFDGVPCRRQHLETYPRGWPPPHEWGLCVARLWPCGISSFKLSVGSGHSPPPLWRSGSLHGRQCPPLHDMARSDPSCDAPMGGYTEKTVDTYHSWL